MKILRAMYEQRPSRLFPLVQCPVLMLPARRPAEDRWERQRLEQRAVLVENAERALRDVGTPVEVHWFEDTIHDVPLQRPDELVERIQRFVGTLAGPTGTAGPSEGG